MDRRSGGIEAGRLGGSSRAGAVPPVALAAFAAIVLLGSVVAGVGRVPGYRGIALYGIAGIAVAGSLALVVPRLIAEQRSANTLRRRYPDRPWMWRDDWAAGRAVTTFDCSVDVRWGVALIWNAVTAPALFAAPVFAEEENGVGVGAFAFGLIGLIGLLKILQAVGASVRFRRFGAGVLELAAVPIELGGKLEGQIVGLRSRPNTPVRLTLTCMRRVISGSGRFLRVRKVVLWRESATVAPEMIAALASGGAIPVAFDMPAGQPQTRDEEYDAIVWSLMARTMTRGIGYHEQFEVPVFAATGPGR